MNNIRLHFSKTFDAKYISHLDLMRVFTRALRQSGLDLWYTEGFNSHLYITFALPLSLGYESICETADIRLLGESIDGYCVQRINGGLPFGLEVFNAAAPVFKPGEIGFSRYIIELEHNACESERLLASFNELLAKPSIEVHKRTKKGADKVLELKQYIKSCDCRVMDKKLFVETVLPCAGDECINPSLLLGAFWQQLGFETDHCLVKRTQVLTKDMKIFE